MHNLYLEGQRYKLTREQKMILCQAQDVAQYAWHRQISGESLTRVTFYAFPDRKTERRVRRLRPLAFYAGACTALHQLGQVATEPIVPPFVADQSVNQLELLGARSNRVSR